MNQPTVCRSRYFTYYNVIYEMFGYTPSIATFDRPDVARYRKENSTILARSVMEWHLNIILADGTQFTLFLGQINTQ